MTKKTFSRSIIAAAFVAAFSITAFAKSLDVQIYSPWNEYYGRIFKGADHGLKTGQKLDIYKDGQKIGDLILSDVSGTISRGKFIPSQPDFTLGNAEAALPGKTLNETIILSGEPVTLGDEKAKTAENYKFSAATIEPEDAPAVDASDQAIRPTVSPCAKPAEEITITRTGENKLEPAPEFGSPAYHLKQAKMFMSIEKYDAALEHYSIALKMTPSMTTIQDNMEEAALMLGIVEEPAAKKEPVPEAPAPRPLTTDGILNNFGVYLIGKGNYRDALARLSEAIALNPGDPVYYRNSALANYYIQDYAAAVDDASIAVELGDESASALLADLKILIPTTERKPGIPDTAAIDAAEAAVE